MSARRVITFGCRLNTYESAVMAEFADGDTVIVNTCAVTGEAERQARQAIRRARRENPRACLVVTGCAAQIAPERFAAMAEVDRVLGNGEKMNPALWRNDADAIVVGDIMALRESAGHMVAGFDGRARAFVQVQNGCDHRCTFCIIPFGRGNSRTVPMGAIVREVRALVDKGYGEVVLTGVDLTAYGADLPGRPRLGAMVRRLLAAVPALERLRLTSLDPVEIDDELYRLVAHEARLMPHFHLSLQAGSDLILKRMRRRHSRAEAIEACRRLSAARPEASLGADLIAGFPTETEAMFADTRDLIGACGLTLLHVFPYSPRPGTPAARMPEVPAGVRRERARTLREDGARALAADLRRRVGSRVTALVERPGLGRSEHYLPVRITGDAAPGTVVPVRITGADDATLLGAIA